MIWNCASSGKLNLTLRIVGITDNGYHRLVSVFKKLPALEQVALEPLKQGSKDMIEVIGADVKGVNLVQRVIDMLRGGGISVPPLFVSISKTVPPGTGLGAGTGNGAAVFSWARDIFSVDPKLFDLPSIGADLPFLASNDQIAMVSGIGERFFPLEDVFFKTVLIIPKWRCATVESFKMSDDFYASRSGWPMSEIEAEHEAVGILARLRDGVKVGLLPNDFVAPLIDQHSEYRDLFSVCESSGAIAWGISGSGSSVFSLYRSGETFSGSLGGFDKLSSVEKIIFLR